MSKLLPFRIRPLEARDIPAVISVDRIVFKDPWPESAYVQELYLNPSARYFVLQLTRPPRSTSWKERWVMRAAQILGFVGLRIETGGKGHISTLGVRPEWRGRGLGEYLLVTALEQSIQDGAESVTLEVRVSNLVAQQLYVKYGFVEVARLGGYYADGEDAYLMRVGPLDADYRWRLQTQHSALMARLQVEAEEMEKP
jgi:ribosomal-protein-alanine N-acetyltransferase